MSLKGLFHNLKITTIHKKFSGELVALPRLFEIIKSYDDEYSWRPTPYHYLTVENEGVCPGQFCRSNINLTLQRLTNETITIWDHVGLNTFASKLVFLTLNKPYTFGFAIKFWQWMDLSLEHTEKVTVTEQVENFVEKVFVVFVNYTDVQIINASQCDVMQLCHKLNCQPNLNSRKQFTSIEVKHIDSNKFPELISYWSSYNAHSLKALTSKVQVIKMDSIMSNLIHGSV